MYFEENRIGHAKISCKMFLVSVAFSHADSIMLLSVVVGNVYGFNYTHEKLL